VEVGPDGAVYASLLPGGPEDPSARAGRDVTADRARGRAPRRRRGGRRRPLRDDAGLRARRAGGPRRPV